MTPVEVTTFGEALVALAPAAGGTLREAGLLARHVGGAEVNVAVALARLGHGVAYAGWVGDDPFGHVVADRLRAEGVGVDHLRLVAGARTGIYLREQRTGGRLSAHYHRAGSAASTMTGGDVDPDALAGRVLHLTGITPALSDGCAEACRVLAREARARGMEVWLDANLRWRLLGERAPAALLAPLLELCDVLVLAEEEADALLGGHAPADLERFRARGFDGLVVVHGAEEAVVVSADGVVTRPATAVDVVDPVGAGDAFAAGLISSRLRGEGLEQGLAAAHAAGACAVGVAGDAESMPWPEDLEALRGAAGVER